MEDSLIQQISYEKAYRDSRMKAARWILDHPDCMEELLEICLDPQRGDLADKGCWALEFVAKEELQLLFPHMDQFCEGLERIDKDQSLRPLAHICEMWILAAYKRNDPMAQEVLTPTNKEHLVNNSFDWLITDQKVACQVRAMTCLYYLGTEQDWIHPELIEVLQRNMHQGSPGYKARAKKIRTQIEKFNIKT